MGSSRQSAVGEAVSSTDHGPPRTRRFRPVPLAAVSEKLRRVERHVARSRLMLRCTGRSVPAAAEDGIEADAICDMREPERDQSLSGTEE